MFNYEKIVNYTLNPFRRDVFIVVEGKELLSEQQYDRLKKQIDDVWPKGRKRPVLLEGGLKVVKL